MDGNPLNFLGDFCREVRHHCRISFDDDSYAGGLWAAGLSESLEGLSVGGRRCVGLNENIRIYKYAEGDVFGQHVDGSNVTAQGRTEYTLPLGECKRDSELTLSWTYREIDSTLSVFDMF